MEHSQPSAVPISYLPGTGSLLSRSWAVYKKLLKPLLTISVLMGATLLVYFGLTSLLNFAVHNASHVIQSFIEVVNTILKIGSYFVYAYFFAAMLYIAKHRDEVIDVKGALLKAKGIYRSIFWIGLVSALAMYGAAVTVVLPFLMTIWFYFGMYVLVGEDLRGIEAILKSRYLLRGHWFASVGRYFALSGIIAGIVFVLYFTLAIPVMGGVLFALLVAALALLAIPFFAVYDYLRYEDLSMVIRSQKFMYFKGERNAVVFFAIVGALIVSFLWMWTLLTCTARTNIGRAFDGVAITASQGFAINAGSNINTVFSALHKVVYTFTPDYCPLPKPTYDTSKTYDPYQTTTPDQPAYYPTSQELQDFYGGGTTTAPTTTTPSTGTPTTLPSQIIPSTTPVTP